VEPKWLFYLVQTTTFVEAMSGLVQGALYPAVRPKDIRGYRVPIASVPEQRRIVAEIEKQFTRLDAGVEALKRAQAQLKRYRASVLKAACEGRLVPTEAEIARHEKRDYEPAATLLHRLSQAGSETRKRAGRLWGAGVVPELTDSERLALPEGWTWAKVSALGTSAEETVQVGPMSMKSCEFQETGVAVLNVGCVKWGFIDESNANHLPQERAEAFDRYRIVGGDVLFTRSGTVGRCAVAKDRHAGWLMTFHLLRARPDPRKCLPEYLRTVFEGAPHIRRQTREASIGTTRAGFNTNLLAMLDVPLPPIPEQARIVTEVEDRLSVVEAADALLKNSLARGGRLRQSILKCAFEGKLVPQDPKDEPATVLLERIRAQQQLPPARGESKKNRRAKAATAA
jgi:type I restriction enzyme S subunit